MDEKARATIVGAAYEKVDEMAADPNMRRFAPPPEESEARRLVALDMRVRGNTLQQIADRLNVSVAAVSNMISKQIKAAKIESAEEIIQIELARLDHDFNALTAKAILGDVGAIQTRLKIMERRARLLGLDQPLKVDIREELLEEAKKMGLDEDAAIAAVEEILRVGATG